MVDERFSSSAFASPGLDSDKAQALLSQRNKLWMRVQASQ